MGFKFESLDVWKRSIDFADEMFSLAQALPREYQFSLGEQLRRASLSVPTNIAEGSGRDNPKEKHYFFRIAALSMKLSASWSSLVNAAVSIMKVIANIIWKRTKSLPSFLP